MKPVQTPNLNRKHFLPIKLPFKNKRGDSYSKSLKTWAREMAAFWVLGMGALGCLMGARNG